MDGILYERNPRYSLDSEYFELVSLWQHCGAGGLGGRLLPDPGGVSDQPALVMDAFAIMDAAQHEYTKKS